VKSILLLSFYYCLYSSHPNRIVRFGPIVMVLEGGYNLHCIAKSVTACIKVLLGDTSVVTCDMDSLPYETT
jgi:acetoin utilization deacetylase AcuC-like enzyme